MEIQKKLTNLQNIKKSIPSKKNNNNKLSFSSNEIDIEKQDNLPKKKLIKVNNLIFPKINKCNSQKIISINKKLINDLNYQIKNTNKKIFGNNFMYKQTINLMELNDYIIYEQTKRNILINKNKGVKNSVDFRIPLIYRRIANHYKKEDLIPMKNRPKINLEDILINHNSIFRKSMSQNRCQKYYLKNSIKLMYNNNNNTNNNKTSINFKKTSNIFEIYK